MCGARGGRRVISMSRRRRRRRRRRAFCLGRAICRERRVIANGVFTSSARVYLDSRARARNSEAYRFRPPICPSPDCFSVAPSCVKRRVLFSRLLSLPRPSEPKPCSSLSLSLSLSLVRRRDAAIERCRFEAAAPPMRRTWTSPKRNKLQIRSLLPGASAGVGLSLRQRADRVATPLDGVAMPP